MLKIYKKRVKSVSFWLIVNDKNGNNLLLDFFAVDDYQKIENIEKKYFWTVSKLFESTFFEDVPYSKRSMRAILSSLGIIENGRSLDFSYTTQLKDSIFQLRHYYFPNELTALENKISVAGIEMVLHKILNTKIFDIPMSFQSSFNKLLDFFGTNIDENVLLKEVLEITCFESKKIALNNQKNFKSFLLTEIGKVGNGAR